MFSLASAGLHPSGVDEQSGMQSGLANSVFGTHRVDGARSIDGKIEGSYVHGLMRSDAFRQQWLQTVAALFTPEQPMIQGLRYSDQVEDALYDVAAEVAAALDVEALFALAH